MASRFCFSVDVQVQDARWKALLRPYRKTVRAACEAALRSSPRRVGEVTIVLADDAFVRKLNRDFRGQDKPTNVLSFPASSPRRRGSQAKRSVREEAQDPRLRGDDAYLGDIVLALETIRREAKEQAKSFRDHATHLIVHGALHLLGYDHIRDKDARVMEPLEIKILKKLGVKNPYL